MFKNGVKFGWMEWIGLSVKLDNLNTVFALTGLQYTVSLSTLKKIHKSNSIIRFVAI